MAHLKSIAFIIVRNALEEAFFSILCSSDLSDNLAEFGALLGAAGAGACALALARLPRLQ
jgi:hypothetical protein